MEYHGDRFEDASVMVWEGEELLAVFPAHRIDDQVFSHLGLSFGGFIFKKSLPLERQKSIIQLILEYYKKKSIKSLSVTPVPYYYTQEQVSDEILFNSLGFEEDGNKEIYLIQSPFILKDKGKRKGVRRAVKKGLEVREGEVDKEFWKQLLEPLYHSKIGKAPVHSWEEISFLAERHPGKIKQLSAYQEGELLAGLVIFRHPEVIKVQYSAVTEKGKACRAMDFLMHYLMNFSEIKFLDMGTVNDGQTGEKLESLAYWKESFGAVSMNLPTFRIQF